MSEDMSMIHLVTQASVVVQAVMSLLLLASILSWAMIFMKWKVVRRARAESEEFEDRFWSGADLGKLFERVRGKEAPSGMEHIFAAGFRTYARMGKQSSQSALAVTDAVQRSMRVALSREVDALESYMSFLATVGSISPYVGLFGTVWGIMNSFHGIGLRGSASLAVAMSSGTSS